MTTLVDIFIQPTSLLVWLLLAGMLILILRMWNEKTARMLTARLFLKYASFRIGMFIVVIGAIAEVVAYSLAILFNSFSNIYVVLAFVISTGIYFIGLAKVLWLLLPRGGTAQNKTLNKLFGRGGE